MGRYVPSLGVLQALRKWPVCWKGSPGEHTPGSTRILPYLVGLKGGMPVPEILCRTHIALRSC